MYYLINKEIGKNQVKMDCEELSLMDIVASKHIA